MAQVIAWDCGEQPDWGRINDALKSERVKKIVEVGDTGQDVVAIVVGVETKRQAQRAWDSFIEDVNN